MTSWKNILNYAKGEIRAIVPVTGTTAVNTYVEVVDLDCRWMGETNFTIANTEAVNALDYKIVIYNDYAAGVGHIITSNTIAVSDSDTIILRRHARVKVYVKPTSSGNHTDYQIDVIAGR